MYPYSKEEQDYIKFMTKLTDKAKELGDDFRNLSKANQEKASAAIGQTLCACFAAQSFKAIIDLYNQYH